MWREAEKFLLKDKYITKPRVDKDYFQALCGEIIGQQLSGRVADVIEGRLKAKIKGRLTLNKDRI